MGGEEGGRRKNTFASWPASAPLNPPFAGRSVGAFAQQAPHIPCLLQAGRRQKQGGEAHEWTARMGKGFNKKKRENIHASAIYLMKRTHVTFLLFLHLSNHSTCFDHKSEQERKQNEATILLSPYLPPLCVYQCAPSAPANGPRDGGRTSEPDPPTPFPPSAAAMHALLLLLLLRTHTCTRRIPSHLQLHFSGG